MKNIIQTKISLIIAAVILSTVIFSGCSSGRSSSYEAEYETTAYYDAPADLAVTADGAYAPQASISKEEVSNSSAAGAVNGPQVTSDSRKLIKTVDLVLETTEFNSLVETISSKVAELGGYIESSNVNGNSMSYYGGKNLKTAYITVRIPSDKLDSFVTIVEGSGNVTNKSQNISDVTLQYSDIESRQKTLKVEQDRLWQLLEKAESVDAIITIESRLSEIRYELESYESQLRLYDNQVDYSTVTLSINEVEVFTPTSPDSVGTRIRNGFASTIISLKDDATDLFIFLIVKSPVIVIWIIVLIVLIIIIKKIIKHDQKKSKDKNVKVESTEEKPDNKNQ